MPMVYSATMTCHVAFPQPKGSAFWALVHVSSPAVVDPYTPNPSVPSQILRKQKSWRIRKRKAMERLKLIRLIRSAKDMKRSLSLSVALVDASISRRFSCTILACAWNYPPTMGFSHILHIPWSLSTQTSLRLRWETRLLVASPVW